MNYLFSTESSTNVIESMVSVNGTWRLLINYSCWNSILQLLSCIWLEQICRMPASWQVRLSSHRLLFSLLFVVFDRIVELMHNDNRQNKQETVKRANKKSDVYNLVCFLKTAY